jgi:hypothetical protein
MLGRLIPHRRIRDRPDPPARDGSTVGPAGNGANGVAPSSAACTIIGRTAPSSAAPVLLRPAAAGSSARAGWLHPGSHDGRPGGPGRTARAGNRSACAGAGGVAACPDAPRSPAGPWGPADLRSTGRSVPRNLLNPRRTRSLDRPRWSGAVRTIQPGGGSPPPARPEGARAGGNGPITAVAGPVRPPVAEPGGPRGSAPGAAGPAGIGDPPTLAGPSVGLVEVAGLNP